MIWQIIGRFLLNVNFRNNDSVFGKIMPHEKAGIYSGNGTFTGEKVETTNDIL